MTAHAVTDPWVCIECGGRQADEAACRRCRNTEVLDARKEQVRELMADVDLRLGDAREAKLRWGGVAIGVGLVFALWMVPGYWGLRGALYPGLPFFADQWGFMIVIAFLVMKLGKKLVGHTPRFPYLNEQQQIVDP